MSEDNNTQPTPPKRALTAYFRFRGDVYNEVKENNTDLAPKEVMSKIGAMWRELDEDKKAVYKKAYTEDQAVYKEKLAAYEEKYGKVVKKKKKSKKQKKSSGNDSDSDSESSESSESSEDPNKPDPPKRPLSTFFRFVSDKEADFKKKFPDLKRTALVGKLSLA